MINPTLAQAHLNKGEPAMVQPTPMVGNLMDAGTASKVALNPQQQISAQQLLLPHPLPTLAKPREEASVSCSN